MSLPNPPLCCCGGPRVPPHPAPPNGPMPRWRAVGCRLHGLVMLWPLKGVLAAFGNRKPLGWSGWQATWDGAVTDQSPQPVRHQLKSDLED